MKLPPYPKYKPSGVEWLGEVPEHGGGLKRLRYSATINDNALPETTDPAFAKSYVDISSVGKLGADGTFPLPQQPVVVFRRPFCTGAVVRLRSCSPELRTTSAASSIWAFPRPPSPSSRASPV